MESISNDEPSKVAEIDPVVELSGAPEASLEESSQSGGSGSRDSDGVSVSTDSSEESSVGASTDDAKPEPEADDLTKFMKSAACALMLPLNEAVVAADQGEQDMKRISARVFVRRRELMPECALFHSIRTLTASVVSVCFYGTLAQAKAMACKTPRIFFHTFSYEQAVASSELSTHDVLLLVKIRQSNEQAHFGYATGSILTPKALLYESAPGLRQAYLESLPDYAGGPSTDEPLYCCVWEYTLTAIGTTVRNLGGSRSVTIDLDAVYKTDTAIHAVAAEFGVRLDVQPGHSSREGKPKKRRFRSLSAAPQPRKKRLDDFVDLDTSPRAPKSPKEKKAKVAKKLAVPRAKRAAPSTSSKRPPRVSSLKLTVDGLVPNAGHQTDFSRDGFYTPPMKSFAIQEDRNYPAAYKPPYFPDNWERRVQVPRFLPQGFFVPVYAPPVPGFAPSRSDATYGLGANLSYYAPSVEGTVPAQMRDESEPARFGFVDLPPVALTLPHASPSLYMSHQMYSSECEHSTSAHFSASFSASYPPQPAFDADLTPTSPLDDMDSLSFETEAALWASSDAPSQFTPFPSFDEPDWPASSPATEPPPPQAAPSLPNYGSQSYANNQAEHEPAADFW